MEINLQAIEDRRKQIMAQLDQLAGQVNFLRGQLAELQTMEDFLKTEAVPEDDTEKIHAV